MVRGETLVSIMGWGTTMAGNWRGSTFYSVLLRLQPPAGSRAPSLTSKQFIRVRSPAGWPITRFIQPRYPPHPPCQPRHTHKNLRTPCNLGQTHHVATNLQQAYHENGCVNIAANWGSRAAVSGQNWWPPEDVRGTGSQASDHIRANYDPCVSDTITHTDAH